MSLKSRNVEVSPEVLVQTVAGESVLLDLKSEKYFGLNTLGTRFWALIAQGGGLRATRDRLLEEYDVTGDVLDADLDELIDRLLAAGLLVDRN